MHSNRTLFNSLFKSTVAFWPEASIHDNSARLLVLERVLQRATADRNLAKALKLPKISIEQKQTSRERTKTSGAATPGSVKLPDTQGQTHNLKYDVQRTNPEGEEYSHPARMHWKPVHVTGQGKGPAIHMGTASELDIEGASKQNKDRAVVAGHAKKLGIENPDLPKFTPEFKQTGSAALHHPKAAQQLFSQKHKELTPEHHIEGADFHYISGLESLRNEGPNPMTKREGQRSSVKHEIQAQHKDPSYKQKRSASGQPTESRTLESGRPSAHVHLQHLDWHIDEASKKHRAGHEGDPKSYKPSDSIISAMRARDDLAHQMKRPSKLEEGRLTSQVKQYGSDLGSPKITGRGVDNSSETALRPLRQDSPTVEKKPGTAKPGTVTVPKDKVKIIGTRTKQGHLASDPEALESHLNEAHASHMSEYVKRNTPAGASKRHSSQIQEQAGRAADEHVDRLRSNLTQPRKVQDIKTSSKDVQVSDPKDYRTDMGHPLSRKRAQEGMGPYKSPVEAVAERIGTGSPQSASARKETTISESKHGYDPSKASTFPSYNPSAKPAETERSKRTKQAKDINRKLESQKLHYVPDIEHWEEGEAQKHSEMESLSDVVSMKPAKEAAAQAKYERTGKVPSSHKDVVSMFEHADPEIATEAAQRHIQKPTDSTAAIRESGVFNADRGLGQSPLDMMIAREDAAAKPRASIPSQTRQSIDREVTKPKHGRGQTTKQNENVETQTVGGKRGRKRIIVRQNKSFTEALKNALYEQLKKALTAGTGYAGAPGDMAGGSILMTEELDKKPKSTTLDLKHCDKCNKDTFHFNDNCMDCTLEKEWMPNDWEKLKKESSKVALKSFMKRSLKRGYTGQGDYLLDIFKEKILPHIRKAAPDAPIHVYNVGGDDVKVYVSKNKDRANSFTAYHKAFSEEQHLEAGAYHVHKAAEYNASETLGLRDTHVMHALEHLSRASEAANDSEIGELLIDNLGDWYV